jgi:hypothetical protein
MQHRPTFLLYTADAVDHDASRSVWVEIPPVGTADFGDWAAGLGRDIDEHGLAGAAPRIAALVRLAHHYQVTPRCREILGDTDQPEPARNRALSHVLTALCARRPIDQRAVA